VRASWAGTLLFAATAIAATVAGDRNGDAGAMGPVRGAALVVALGLFAAGTVAFLAAYAVAVNRSREDAIGIGGLYFLAGTTTAPRATKRALLASLTAQTAVALVTAGARPYTTLAFGILVPVYGLGLTGLWGARHGTFERRNPRDPGIGSPPP
jgi:hypothetical protein